MSMQVVEDRVQRYRDSHHRIAEMFAMGLTPSMIRRQTGISIRRLSLYLADPTFQELIASKTAKVAAKIDDAIDAYADSAIANMLRAEQQITDHLDQAEEAGELLPVNILDKISQGRADRFGYSKHSVVKHEHDFAAALDRAIARSGKGEAIKTIEGVVAQPSLPVAPALSPPVAEEVLPQSRREPPRSFARVLEPIKRRRIA